MEKEKQGLVSVALFVVSVVVCDVLGVAAHLGGAGHMGDGGHVVHVCGSHVVAIGVSGLGPH